MPRDGLERRRGELDPLKRITYRELRDALQPLYDMKNRVEPPMRFWEQNRPMIEKYLLPLLETEETRQVLRRVSQVNWRRWYRLALVLGSLYTAVTLVGGTMAILRTAGVIH